MSITVPRLVYMAIKVPVVGEREMALNVTKLECIDINVFRN